jgi:hypothetical protein
MYRWYWFRKLQLGDTEVEAPRWRPDAGPARASREDGAPDAGDDGRRGVEMEDAA